MSSTTFWGYWDCTSCGSYDVSGEHKECPSCGSPREDDELSKIRPNRRGYALDLSKPVDNQGVKSVNRSTEAGSKAGRVGSDLVCQYCGTTNWATNTNCIECGASGWDKHVPGPEPARPIKKPLPQQDIFQSAANGHDTSEPARIRGRTKNLVHYDDANSFSDPVDWRRSSNPNRDYSRPILIAFAVLVLFGGIGLLVWSQQTKNYEAEVIDTSWVRRTHRDTFQETQDENWEDSIRFRNPVMPVNGVGEDPGAIRVSCHQKYYGEGPEYVCGTESYQESHTRSVSCGSHQDCSTSSNGDGSFTQNCTTVQDYCNETYYTTESRNVYCTDPVYESWCKYDTWHWVEVHIARNSGVGPKVGEYPDKTNVGSLDRTRRSSDYEVLVQWIHPKKGPQHYTHAPGSAPAYSVWEQGQVGIIPVKNSGGIGGFDRTVFTMTEDL
jgi:hypothetical protein